MTVIRPQDYVVHVNRGKIDSNRKRQKDDPAVAPEAVLKVQKGKTGKGSYGQQVEVLDQDGRVAATFVYDPSGLLACGAKVVLIAPYGARVADKTS